MSVGLGPAVPVHAGDTTVCMLTATAVGFVEARVGLDRVGRLRELAAHEPMRLHQAMALAQCWGHVAPDARRAAVQLLAKAANPGGG